MDLDPPHLFHTWSPESYIYSSLSPDNHITFTPQHGLHGDTLIYLNTYKDGHFWTALDLIFLIQYIFDIRKEQLIENIIK